MQDTSRVLEIHVPADTPAGASIYLAGDFNGWSPAHPLARVTAREDGAFRFTLPTDVERAEFKITRGSWDSVECTRDGRPIDNRVWKREAGNSGARLSVDGWCDLHPETLDWRPRHTNNGDVRMVNDVFAPQLGNMRDLFVLVPPEYDNRTDERYPVLYMHDGQNLFDDVMAFDKEWGVDEVSLDLARLENLRHIVVGIPNVGVGRLHEYSPWEDDFRRSRGFGERYVRFLTQTVKPLIDKQFRTKTAAESTAVCGSSLGGLISLYAGLTRPDVFSAALCLSPTMNVAAGRALKLAQSYSGGTRFWLDYGAREFGGNRELSNQMIDAVLECARVLRDNGVRVKAHVDPVGEHNETSWRRRLPDILRWWHSELPK
ncbi:MAG: alpha/beta hydrolase [bacterium]|nr:alpha/beta hydrolase [bacterium]